VTPASQSGALQLAAAMAVPMLCTAQQKVPILLMGRKPQSYPFPTPIYIPNYISVGSSVFAGFTVVTNRRTHKVNNTHKDHKNVNTTVAIGRIDAMHAIRPGGVRYVIQLEANLFRPQCVNQR